MEEERKGLIVIPALEVEMIGVTIVGMTPLVQNRMSYRGRTGPATERHETTPKEEFENSLYRTVDGRYGHPASSIKGATVKAGERKFIPGKPGTQIIGSYFVLPDVKGEHDDDLIYLAVDGREPEMYSVMANVGQKGKKVAVLRTRARWDLPWSITFRVVFNPKLVRVESLLHWINTAGFHIGIGDWRPEKGGTKGMFRIQGAKELSHVS